MASLPDRRPPLSPYWAGLLILYLVLDLSLLQPFAIGSDWAPLWAASRVAWSDPGRLYDFTHLTSLQAPVLGALPERPFIHPPSALLFTAPFAWLPFWPSLAVFTVAGSLALARAGRAVGAHPLLLLAAPPVVLAALAGQPLLLAAAFAAGGVALLPTNERTAGTLLGLAAAIKPPLLLLAPLALVAGRHWRALAWAAAAGCACAALSIALFGIRPWLDWLAALPRFQQLFASSPPLLANALAPSAVALRFGMSAHWLPLAAACVAVPVAMATFARCDGAAMRLLALLGGALLVTPYAMNYELAALAPAVLSKPPRSLKDFAIPFVWAASLFAGLSVAGLIAAYAWLLVRLRPTIRAWSAGSTLPPDSTTTMPSAGSTLPARTAASATAPPGSTTSSCASQA